MKTILMVSLLFILCSIHVHAQLKIDENHFKKLFDEGNYVQAYNDAMAIRKNQAYGKNYFIDYLIGKSLCNTGNYPTAQKCYDYIISAYPVESELKSKLKSEILQCNSATGSGDLDSMMSMLNLLINQKNNIPVAVSRGKMGWILKCNEIRSSESTHSGGDFNLSVNKTNEELSQRLFATTQGNEALNYYKNLLGAKYNIEISGRFIIITELAMTVSKAEVLSAATRLEKAYNFFSSWFKVQPPDKLIAVYLMGNKTALDKAALIAHGLKLPSVNIGYSCISDLSILGNSNAKNVGTLYHELFHLVIRTDIGDIPAWLDEGIAALYETSKWQNEILKGDINNWRTEVLSEYMKTSSIKPLESLIKENWNGFTINSYNDACNTAVNYALSKHFAIFMQERNWLQPVVNAFRERKNVFIDTTYNNESPITVLENSVGLNMDSIQILFSEWLYETYRIGMRSNRGVESLLAKLYYVNRNLEIMQHENLDPKIEKERLSLFDTSKHYIDVMKISEQQNINNNIYEQESRNNLIPIDLNEKVQLLLDKSNHFIRTHSKPGKGATMKK